MTSPIDTRQTMHREHEAFERAVARDERRIAERPERKGNPLMGLATLGVVGWSVAIPMLAGIALGMWLDRRFPDTGISWTLALLMAGLVLGAANAWYWVDRESRVVAARRGRDGRG